MMSEKTEIMIGLLMLILTAAGSGLAVNNYLNKGDYLPISDNTANNITSDQNNGFTLNEISQHAAAADCWIVINNKVYGVSDYLVEHPGGSAAITPFCGTDATQAFVTKGGGGAHSNFAYEQLVNYFLGQVAGSTTASAIPNSGTTTPSPSTATVINSQQPVTNPQVNLTMSEVAKHNSSADCWFVINNKVYNVTNYLNHPGGRQEIIAYCGTDATNAFTTQGGSGSHSSRAQADLANWYLGPLNGTASLSAPVPVVPSANNKKSDDDMEEEYEDN